MRAFSVAIGSMAIVARLREHGMLCFFHKRSGIRPASQQNYSSGLGSKHSALDISQPQTAHRPTPNRSTLHPKHWAQVGVVVMEISWGSTRTEIQAILAG